jgi:trehalose 6-phosphate synthase/phosphatase
MDVAAELRRLGVGTKSGFFLHIPFPSLDMFLKLP